MCDFRLSVCALAVGMADHSPDSSEFPAFFPPPSSTKTDVEERRGCLIINWGHRPKERAGEMSGHASARHVSA